MRTLLLIDDDTSLLRVTEYNLSQGGFTVVAASSGKEGLALFNTIGPDIVVTDIQLGDMDGLEVLQQIKQDAPEVPVIVITAFGSLDTAIAAIRAGA